MNNPDISGAETTNSCPSHPQPSSARAWLHTLTPYGGGMTPDAHGKATAYNGFYSLPEVGERVLVEFLGQ